MYHTTTSFSFTTQCFQQPVCGWLHCHIIIVLYVTAFSQFYGELYGFLVAGATQNSAPLAIWKNVVLALSGTPA